MKEQDSVSNAKKKVLFVNNTMGRAGAEKCLQALLELHEMKSPDPLPEDCVKEARRLCDELGDGGLIISENKMLSYRNDCNGENYLAVCDFLKDYRV